MTFQARVDDVTVTYGWCLLPCYLRGLAERVFNVQPWQKCSDHLSGLMTDAARVEELLQASIAPATRRKYDAYWSRWLTNHRLTTRRSTRVGRLNRDVPRVGRRRRFADERYSRSCGDVLVPRRRWLRSADEIAESCRPFGGMEKTAGGAGVTRFKSGQYRRSFGRSVPPAANVLRRHRRLGFLRFGSAICASCA